MVSPADFDFLRALIRDRSAIVLEPGKEYLVASRLQSLLRGEGLGSPAELVARLRAEPRGELERRMVEAMTTNETSFFRDHHPFEVLRTRLLPELLAARRAERRLRIWSNACATGQEAYSLAMLLREHFPELGDWDVGILASDLSREMVARTAAGVFGQLEVNRGLPAAYLLKYFDRHGTSWQVKPALRALVHARTLNLIEPWPALPAFDVILLRNVLIYFDLETKRAVLRRVRQALRPGGLLLLGSAETTLLIDDGWERLPVGLAAIYRLPAVVAGEGRARRAVGVA